MSDVLSSVERWRAVKNAMAGCRGVGAERRAPPVLIAVSKGHSAEAIEPLLAAGQRDFGENRVQEALLKWPALKHRYPDARLHLIGALQTNKVEAALSLFDAIHTLDRENLVDAIERQCTARTASCAQYFLQVNTGEEPQKSGVDPGGLAALMEYIAHTAPHMKSAVTGLMCIPPADEPPAPHFALLRTLAERFGFSHLSMGMSADYPIALKLGATHVRVGTAIFGERH